jgi:hypothetical protein
LLLLGLLWLCRGRLEVFQMRNAPRASYLEGIYPMTVGQRAETLFASLASFDMWRPAAHATPLPEAEAGEEAGLLSSSDGAAEVPAQAPVQRLAGAAAAVWCNGVVCILASAAFFAVAASLVKAIDKEVSVFQIIVIRSGLSMLASFAAGRASGISPLYGQLRHWPLLGRWCVLHVLLLACCWGIAQLVKLTCVREGASDMS